MRLYLTRTMHGLAAADDTAREYLRKVKQGATVTAEIVKPRSVAFRRRFFAMLGVVYATCGDWNSPEELLTELKFRVGLVDKQLITDRKTGEVLAEIVKPQSISFAAMNEDEFREFVERCIKVICETMVPGLDDAVLREKIANWEYSAKYDDVHVAALRKDAERLDWLERHLFEGKWDGTIGRPKSWHMAGPYRHTLKTMHGDTLRKAIDAAMGESHE